MIKRVRNGQNAGTFESGKEVRSASYGKVGYWDGYAWEIRRSSKFDYLILRGGHGAGKGHWYYGETVYQFPINGTNTLDPDNENYEFDGTDFYVVDSWGRWEKFAA